MQVPILTPADFVTQLGEESSTQTVIQWSLERFADQKMVLSTWFGMEGCALIEMYAAHQKPLDIIYLDTGFFFKETHELIEKLKTRHPHLNFINRGTTLTPEKQADLFGDELWKRDPDLCCQLRKVDPMRAALKEVDVWVTALRRDQSANRAGVELVEWNWKYQVVRICPLAEWSRQEVWDFVKSQQVPYNELHDQNYPSIGCTHCTKPVVGSAGNHYSRKGRWSGSAKTECGLHT